MCEGTGIIEQRTYLKYCNGAETFYSYDPQRRRLQNLVVNAKAGTIMDNAYSYDAVSNVLGIKNNAPLPQSGKAGGQMSHSYTYDPLYRLASATGTYKGTDNKAASYTLSMGYDNMHRITSKKQHLSQTGVQFDKNGVLNHRLLSKNEGSSDNFSALKTLSESSTNYLFNVSDKDINGKAFFEKGTNRDYPNNYLYGITNLPNAENDPSPDENVYIFTASFLDERTQARNTAHEGYGHAYFYELSKKDPSIDPNHTRGKIGIQKEYDSELKMEIEFPVFGKTNTRLERQISTVEQQALKNYDEKTISIFLLFWASCMSQNQFAYPSTRRECINLLTKKIVLNIPTPVYLKKENYEEGVIYTYIFKDGGCILIHEGALMQFDLDSYKPLKVTHKKTCFISYGIENDKFWKKCVYGSVRLYYRDVHKDNRPKYEKIFRTMKILNIE